MIIERAKSNEEAPSQIDTLANEFQGMEEENKERIEFAKERDEEIILSQKKKEIHFTKGKWEFQERERPRIKRREKAVQWEIEMDSGGKFPRRNMSKAILRNTKEAHFGGFIVLRKERGCKIVWAITRL